MEYLKTLPNEYYIYGGIGILLLGIILGFTKTIIVYRNYADLTKVFMLVLLPVGLFSILGDKIEDPLMKKIFFGVEGILLLWILVTTYIDNRNIFKALLAFITKIPLGVIFGIFLLNIISPSGNTHGKRSQNRAQTGIILLILLPILYGLVRYKGWSAKNEWD